MTDAKSQAERGWMLVKLPCTKPWKYVPLAKDPISLDGAKENTKLAVLWSNTLRKGLVWSTSLKCGGPERDRTFSGYSQSLVCAKHYGATLRDMASFSKFHLWYWIVDQCLYSGAKCFSFILNLLFIYFFFKFISPEKRDSWWRHFIHSLTVILVKLIKSTVSK